MFGYETDVICGGVGEIAVSEVEGTNAEPGVSWPVQDVGETKEERGFAGTMSLGGGEGCDNGMLETT
jgi:hypothetical protein